MTGLDLKPLSDEIIKAMEINPHELWLVKIGDETYGPFESESLKHYAAENEDLFDKALATRMENEEWKPFFAEALFQRRQPQMVKSQSTQKETLFWTLDQGQKTGPFAKNDLDKRVELGAIGFKDLVSTDDGYTWHKLFNMEGFDRRFHASSALPFAPQETELLRAKEALIEKIENPAAARSSEEMAEVAFNAQVGKVLNFRTEDIPLQPSSETILSSNLKWQALSAVAVIVTLVVGVRIMVTGSPNVSQEETPQVANLGERQAPPQMNPNNPWKKPPSALDMPRRLPASTPPGPSYNDLQGIQPDYTPPSYTQIESHHDAPIENNDSYQDQLPPQEFEENREPAAVEHSLVGGSDSFAETPSLDAAMGNPQPVDENSDF